MMAKNKGDSTIKFLIYVLLFLIFILVMLLVFIIPNIKNYKNNKSDVKSFTSQNTHLSQKQVELHQSIEAYKKDHQDLIKDFSQEFNKTQFMAYAGKYFTKVTLVDSPDKNTKTQFQEYLFTASSKAKKPEDFYHFIDALKGYSSVIKINFPITLTSKDDTIDVSFNISVYKQNN